jgi:hypothetical protein
MLCVHQNLKCVIQKQEPSHENRDMFVSVTQLSYIIILKYIIRTITYTEYFTCKHFMLIFIFWHQMRKCTALQGAKFSFLTRQYMCQPIMAILLQQCWGFSYCFSFMGGGGKSLHKKVQSHNLNPCVLQTILVINSSAKELSFLFSYCILQSLVYSMLQHLKFCCPVHWQQVSGTPRSV